MATSKTGGQGGAAKPDRGGSQPKWSPEDDRSNIKNPTHPSYEDDQANRKKQGGGG